MGHSRNIWVELWSHPLSQWKNRWHAILLILIFLIDVVGRYPAWCSLVSHTESINILCGEWKFSVFALRSRFLVTFYFFPHIAQCTKECSAQLVVLSVAPFLHQPSNSAVLVWCCVFCLERRVVIKFTSCWVRSCQAPHARVSFLFFCSPSFRFPQPWKSAP